MIGPMSVSYGELMCCLFWKTITLGILIWHWIERKTEQPIFVP